MFSSIIKVPHAQTLRAKWDIRGLSPTLHFSNEGTWTQRSKMTCLNAIDHKIHVSARNINCKQQKPILINLKFC